jgi:hypothetical protein
VLTRFTFLRATAAALLCAAAVPAAAQQLPAGPVQAFDGKLTAGGDVSATIGERDDSAYFNYTDYEHNALRMLRLAFTAAWKPSDRIAFVGEVRTENLDDAHPYAAYVRVRPWRAHAFDIQAGRIPTAFGAFSRRAYGGDNLLIGFPLAYQYLTSLRTDAVPANTDDLLRMRARGWRSNFQVGSFAQGPGLPLVSAFRWDTGVQASWTGGPVEATAAITSGTLSNPRFGDDNGGRQLSARIAARPLTGLIVGASAARGAWLSDAVTAILPSRRYSQRAVGADAEYSRDHWMVRGEFIWSAWDLPYLGTERLPGTVSAHASWVEGRYRLTPRLFVAARVDRLGFSRVTDSLKRRVPWEAAVHREEGAVGFYLQRNLIARVSLQQNTRTAGRVRQRAYLAGQLSYWF